MKTIFKYIGRFLLYVVIIIAAINIGKLVGYLIFELLKFTGLLDLLIKVIEKITY
jgi:hypothetical protein